MGPTTLFRRRSARLNCTQPTRQTSPLAGHPTRTSACAVKYVLTPKGEEARAADLRGVNLSHVPLRDVYLRRADLSGANLVFADLTGAHLADVTLNDADMGRVILHRGELNYATLTGA